jgi:MoaA/NifB/PqqE/SkfB family radical SAM enzyme
MMTAHAYFVPPAWVLIDRHAQLEAVHFFDKTWLTLKGELREAVLAGGANDNATLQRMAALDADAARLCKALGSHAPLALNAETLLRGPAYDRLFIELTARCNERCVHCYADSHPERTEQLPWEVVRQVLDDARELGFSSIQLTGGDPLLSPILLQAVSHTAELGFEECEIFTNGLALSPGLYQELRRFPVSFAFSLYSHDPAMHDAITRTAGSHERTVRAIRRVVEDGRPVRLGIVLTEANISHAEQVRSFADDIGVAVGAAAISFQHGVGRGTYTETPLDFAWPIGSSHAGPSRAPFAGKACVAYDGAVIPCIFNRNHRLGSVYVSRLHDLLKSAPMRDVDVETITEASERWGTMLSCWDCRLRAALLQAPDTPHPRLLQLGRAVS